MRKKTKVIVTSCIFSLVILCYLQFFRTPFVNSSLTNQHSEGYDMSLSITVNKLLIFDKENLANQLARQVLNNDFENILFSYDVLGYPNAISVTVYTNSFSKSYFGPAFSFHCEVDKDGLFQIFFDK